MYDSWDGLSGLAVGDVVGVVIAVVFLIAVVAAAFLLGVDTSIKYSDEVIKDFYIKASFWQLLH